MIVELGISHETILSQILQDLTDNKSTLVQVMAWCHQKFHSFMKPYWAGGQVTVSYIKYIYGK